MDARANERLERRRLRSFARGRVASRSRRVVRARASGVPTMRAGRPRGTKKQIFSRRCSPRRGCGRGDARDERETRWNGK